MATLIRLTEMPYETQFAPLGVLGYCLTRTQFLAPVWAKLTLPLKEVDHAPAEKLLDVLVSILAGCRAISQINTRLRPDLALARAWGRDGFAEQSTLARTLNTFQESQVTQLRQGSEALFRRESRVLHHNFAADWLWLDIDLTPLPISKHAEASTKGKMEKKNSYGRQLARVHAPQYHETLFSRLYPGKQDSGPTYIPILEALDPCLALTPAQKQRVILRSDSGFGSDANVDRALSESWQILGKGKGGRRPNAWARQIGAADWQALGQERWIARAPQPPTYVRPTQSLVLRWQTATGIVHYSTVVCSLTDWSMTEIIAAYDDRGACETEIQADKGGLKLERRRKKRLAAQEALILLTDLAHNLLAWVGPWMFSGTALAQFGPTRLTEDVFCLPGRLFFDQERLREVQLNERHPHAEAVKEGLEHLLAHFDHP